MDLVTVGAFHPRLWAWRVETTLRSALTGEVKKRAFHAELEARRSGVPVTSFVQGNTPWWLLRRVAAWMGLGAGGAFVDVGAAEGHAAGVLAALTGARGHAVEPLALLRQRAEVALGALELPVKVHASLDDVPVAECGGAYAGWTCFDTDARQDVVTQLERMPAGAVLVSVSYAPPEGGPFQVEAQGRALFPWGPDLVWRARRRA